MNDDPIAIVLVGQNVICCPLIDSNVRHFGVDHSTNSSSSLVRFERCLTFMPTAYYCLLCLVPFKPNRTG